MLERVAHRADLARRLRIVILQFKFLDQRVEAVLRRGVRVQMQHVARFQKRDIGIGVFLVLDVAVRVKFQRQVVVPFHAVFLAQRDERR